MIVATFAISTVNRSLLIPQASYETATWREEMNDDDGIARARWREERRETCMIEGRWAGVIRVSVRCIG